MNATNGTKKDEKGHTGQRIWYQKLASEEVDKNNLFLSLDIKISYLTFPSKKKIE